MILAWSQKFTKFSTGVDFLGYDDYYNRRISNMQLTFDLPDNLPDLLQVTKKEFDG